MSCVASAKTKKTKMPHTGMKSIKCDVSTKTPSEICKASMIGRTSSAKTNTPKILEIVFKTRRILSVK